MRRRRNYKLGGPALQRKLWRVLVRNLVNTQSTRRKPIKDATYRGKDIPIPQMPSTGVSMDVFKRVIARLHNWKCPGIDRLHNFWYKKLTCLHSNLHYYVNRYIMNPQECPTHLGEGMTYMKPKVADTTDPFKFRPITCLNSFYIYIRSSLPVYLLSSVNSVRHKE
jgi:hypothetical protein